MGPQGVFQPEQNDIFMKTRQKASDHSQRVIWGFSSLRDQCMVQSRACLRLKGPRRKP